MRAVVMPRPGPPELLTIEDRPEPHPGIGQIRIRIAACGVCYHDVLNRQGVFPRTRFPAVLGHEVAGVVDETGPEVTGWAVGDRVAVVQCQPCGSCQECQTGLAVLCRAGGGYLGEEAPGGYAQQVVVGQGAAVRVPDSVDLVDAAVAACALGTAWRALTLEPAVRAGDRVLVTGAGGGVGIHAVALAAVLGAEVIAVTSSPEKERALWAAGAADVVVIDSDGRFAPSVKAVTDGRGADVAIDLVGEPVFDQVLHSLRPGGRVTLLGNVTARPLAMAAGLVMLKGLTVVGSVGIDPAGLAEVLSLIEQRRVLPRISAVWPLERAGDAHRALDDRSVTGRLMLVP